jgi:hypothetical protein
MYKLIRITGDPTKWVLQDPIDLAQLTGPAQPLAAQVAHPLQGTMLLSGRAAVSVALLGPQPVGWRPSDVVAPEPVLYLPSPTGPTHSDAWYAGAGRRRPGQGAGRHRGGDERGHGGCRADRRRW